MTEEKHIQYFLGANSPSGFYSLYDHLLPPERANRFYIIKGGIILFACALDMRKYLVKR